MRPMSSEAEWTPQISRCSYFPLVNALPSITTEYVSLPTGIIPVVVVQPLMKNKATIAKIDTSTNDHRRFIQDHTYFIELQQ